MNQARYLQATRGCLRSIVLDLRSVEEAHKVEDEQDNQNEAESSSTIGRAAQVEPAATQEKKQEKNDE